MRWSCRTLLAKPAKVSAHVLANSRNSKASTKVVMTSSRQRIGFSRNSNHRGKAGDNLVKGLTGTFGWTPENSRPRFSARFWIFPTGAPGSWFRARPFCRMHFVMCMATSKRHAQGNVAIWTGSRRRVREADEETRAATRRADARTRRTGVRCVTSLLHPKPSTLTAKNPATEPPVVAKARRGMKATN